MNFARGRLWTEANRGGSLKRREIEEHAPLESGLKVVYKTESSAEACNN